MKWKEKYDKVETGRIPGLQSYFYIRKNKKEGFVDSNGNVLIPPYYEKLYGTNCKVFEAKLNGKFGIIDINNEIKVPFEYDTVHILCKKNFHGVTIKGKYGIVSNDGKLLIPCEHDVSILNK